MKILVPVKRVLDYNIRPRVLPDGSGVDLANVKMSMNPFCEIALEEAVCLKEQGVAQDILAVSIGPDAAQDTLRSALAMGADRALLVRHEAEIEPLGVAKLLAEIARTQEPDLIILGKQSIDDDCAQTGQMLAALLNWPQACFASELTIEDETILVTREIETGTETLRLRRPAIVTADLRLNEPRFISLPSLMRARQKTIETIEAQDYGVDVSPRLQIEQVSPPSEREKGEQVPDVPSLIARLQSRGVL